MRRLLLVTTLLSLAMSEDILTENRARPKRVWIRDKQFRKTRRAPQDDAAAPEMEELSSNVGDGDDRRFPRISDTRFIGEPKLPLLALTRRADAEWRKVNAGRALLLISLGFQQDGAKMSGDAYENCSTKKSHHYRRRDQGAWQLQQPFYVDEPRWIEIEADGYVDGASRRAAGDDPYILTRGKKILRLEEEPERASKFTAEDYDESPGYPGKDKRPPATRNRVRRSVQLDDRINASGLTRKNETHAFERTGDKAHDLIMVYNDGLSHGRNLVSENGTGTSGNKGEPDHAGKPIKKPWRDDRRRERSTDNGDKSEIYDAEEEEEEEEEDESEAAASLDLIESARIRASPRGATKDDGAAREKRDACRDPGCVSVQMLRPMREDQWLRNIEREIQDSLPLVRRDKHREILKSLRLGEPYVISRGKKAPRRAPPLLGDDDEDVARSLLLLDMLLTAATRSRQQDRCVNCDANAVLELIHQPSAKDYRRFRGLGFPPRDRRSGTLDDILAQYDPYYVARGKRANPGNKEVPEGNGVLESSVSWISSPLHGSRIRGVSFDEDATRNGRPRAQ